MATITISGLRRTMPKRMINSNDGGANVSSNAGESWTDQDFPTAQVYNVFVTAHAPYHVCGAQQDNSTMCVPSTGTGEIYPVGGGESGYIAPDPENTDVFYAGSYGGLLTRINRRTGERRSINVWPDNPMGHSSSDITERFQWTFPIVIPPTDPNALYATSQHVWKSTNEGQSWQKVSPDLTRHDPSTMEASGGPITLDQTGVETYATIFTLAPSPKDGEVIWTGSDDGVVHVSRDGGRNWTNVTPPDLPAFTRISLIDASPHNPAVAYLAGNRYQRADRAPYVYKTADYGKSWTKIVAGLPADDFPRVVREDTVRRGLLFLGTETTVYVSVDDGAMWQSLRLDLPVTPVHGLLIKNDDLVIGTHGRSFYIMDNIGVLRQAQRETTNEAIVVFDPADAVRSVSRGVVVDYFLKQPADAVAIEFLDAQGQSIRNFSSTADSPAKPPAAEAEEEEGRWTRRTGRTRDQSPGHEPVHLGYARRERTRVSRPDYVGRKHPGPAGAAGRIHRQGHGFRHHEVPGVCDSAEPGHPERHRCGSRRAVQACAAHQREGVGGERYCRANPEFEGSDCRSAGQDVERRAQEGR